MLPAISSEDPLGTRCGIERMDGEGKKINQKGGLISPSSSRALGRGRRSQRPVHQKQVQKKEGKVERKGGRRSRRGRQNECAMTSCGPPSSSSSREGGRHLTKAGGHTKASEKPEGSAKSGRKAKLQDQCDAIDIVPCPKLTSRL